MKRTLNKIIMVSVALCFACAPGQVFNDDEDTLENKGGKKSPNFSPLNVEDRIISETNFQIEIFPALTLLGFGEERPICKGKATVKLHYPQPRFEIAADTFKINCVGVELAPTQLTSLVEQPADGRIAGINRLSTALKSHACRTPNGCKGKVEDDDILVMNFDPGVPYYLPGIVQDAEELLEVDGLEQKHTVSFSDGRSDIYGESKMEIFGTNLKMQPLSGGYEFDEVVHWKRTLKGFDGFPTEYGGVLPMLGYTKMEWWSNLKPIALVKFRINTILKTVLGADYIASLDSTKRTIIETFKETEVVLQFTMIDFSEK